MLISRSFFSFFLCSGLILASGSSKGMEWKKRVEKASNVFGLFGLVSFVVSAKEFFGAKSLAANLPVYDVQEPSTASSNKRTLTDEAKKRIKKLHQKKEMKIGPTLERYRKALQREMDRTGYNGNHDHILDPIVRLKKVRRAREERFRKQVQDAMEKERAERSLRSSQKRSRANFSFTLGVFLIAPYIGYKLCFLAAKVGFSSPF